MSSSTQASALRQTAQVMRSPSVEVSRIRGLLDRIEELEEENRQLRDALRPDKKLFFTEMGGLSPSQRVIMNKLMNSEYVTHDALINAIAVAQDSTRTDRKSVAVTICHLRKRLAKTRYQIQNIWGIGYRLEVAE